uniref:Uncharacterized protein n=1 Tax=Timema poppense TaxID=170557 RepID=A0A7R9HD90_TIMPO|nr:unnamed protein product [Timema poppensis]
MASLVLTDSSQLTSDSRHLGIYSSPMASLVLTDSSQVTSDSRHLGIYSSPMAYLLLTYSSQLTSDSQHLGIYSSPMASLVLTDSSQLTSDSRHLEVTAAKHMFLQITWFGVGIIIWSGNFSKPSAMSCEHQRSHGAMVVVKDVPVVIFSPPEVTLPRVTSPGVVACTDRHSSSGGGWGGDNGTLLDWSLEELVPLAEVAPLSAELGTSESVTP